MIALLERAIIVAAGASIATTLSVALATRWAARLRALPPRHRVIALELALLLPWITPAIVLASAIAPSLVALAWPAADHCAVHDDLHEHFCLLHPPHDVTASGWTLLALSIALVALARVSLLLRRLAEAHAQVARLCRAARRAGDGTWRLPSDAPMCAVVGLTSPMILVSDGARALVPPEDLAIVLAHERAHVVRRDVARNVLALLATAGHLPAAAAVLSAELAVAREQACDEAAAVAVGDRVRVAEVILHMARLLGSHPALSPSASMAFGPEALSSRVESLLAEPLSLPRLAVVSTIAGLAATAVALPAVHHVLETLLGALLR